MNGFDFSGAQIGLGDWQVIIGGGNGQPVYYPPYGGTGTVGYPQPVYGMGNQNNQLLMLGLVVLALFVIAKQ